MDQFLSACAPVSQVLHTYLETLQEDLRAWIKRREMQTAVCDWQAFPGADESHTVMDFAVLALSSKVAEQLWRDIGARLAPQGTPMETVVPACQHLKVELMGPRCENLAACRPPGLAR